MFRLDMKRVRAKALSIFSVEPRTRLAAEAQKYLAEKLLAHHSRMFSHHFRPADKPKVHVTGAL